MIVLLYAAALWVIGVALIVMWIRRDGVARAEERREALAQERLDRAEYDAAMARARAEVLGPRRLHVVHGGRVG